DRAGHGSPLPQAVGRHHRGVAAETVVTGELGDLPGRVRVAADVAPAQPRLPAHAAPLVGHLRLDLVPAAAWIQSGGFLAEYPCAGPALVEVTLGGTGQVQDHRGRLHGYGRPITATGPFPPREASAGREVAARDPPWRQHQLPELDAA